jgi:glycosyltransferase involved in cell wall biosynthesis
VRPDETCVCYVSSSPQDIAVSTSRLLEDASLRERVRRSAHALVQQQFSLEAMAAAYDHALLTLLGDARRSAGAAQA